MSESWVVQPDVVDGRRFIPVYTCNYRCRQHRENNFNMVQYITKLRNKKVIESMLALAAEDDPNEDNPVLQGMPNRPKKELIGQFPLAIPLDVVTHGGLETSVCVLPSWRVGGCSRSS